jgi:urease accessory protein
MFDAISRSEPRLQRAVGRAAFAVGRSGLTKLSQAAPCRILFPRPAAGEPLQAVLANTAGGVAGGDRLDYAVALEDGAEALVVGQAAEKLYRSSGEDARLGAAMRVGAGAALEWLPQGTIAFDGARLRRSTEIDVAESGRLLAGEILTFGRIAMGEAFRGGLLHDSWRVRRGGRLVWADALRLADARPLAARAGFDGARSFATLIYVAADAPRLLDLARDLIERTMGALRAGATVLGHLLLARWLGRDPAEVRRAFGAFWAGFRGATLGRPAALPAIWSV